MEKLKNGPWYLNELNRIADDHHEIVFFTADGKPAVRLDVKGSLSIKVCHGHGILSPA